MWLVDRIMAPNDNPIQISEIYNYVTLQGKRDFADVIKKVCRDSGLSR